MNTKSESSAVWLLTDSLSAGWGKWMEWMYPVEVKITNKKAFNAAGAVEAAATL